MNIFVTGGTGFIGSHLCSELLREGHKLQLLTRSPEKYRENEADNQRFIGWEDDFTSSMEWADAVINLAGETIFGQRWTRKVKDKIYHSRIDGTRQLVESIEKADSRPEVLVSASAVGYYGDGGDAVLDEQSPPGDDFLARVVRDWEQAARQVSDEVRLVIPRLGIVLEKGGGALQQMLPPFKMFVGGPVGGDQYVPWIHMIDLCNGIKFMLDREHVEGVYNLNAPNPVTMRELAGELGSQLNRPSWLKVPEMALKMVLGEAATPITASLNVSPDKFQRAGYEFTYESLGMALADIISQ